VDKVLRSAIASADEQEANVARLYVVDARIDEGPAYRRWQPKDRGRAHPIRKRTSHIVVTVDEPGREAPSSPSAGARADRG